MLASFAALLGAAVITVSPASAAAPRRVAVLDFGASWSAECVAGAKLPLAQREQCEVLRLFADQARAGALAVLRPPGFVVMTRENTAQILKDMGGVCSDGECEVETARLLGASVVVSGEVTVLEGTYIVSLKVHDVASAALLGTGRTKARTKLEAFENVQAETERMLHGAASLDGVAAAAIAPARPSPVIANPKAAPEAAPHKAPAATPVTAAAAAAPRAALPAAPEPARARAAAGVDGRTRYVEAQLGTGRTSSQLRSFGSWQPFGDAALSLRAGLRLAPTWALEAGGGWLPLFQITGGWNNSQSQVSAFQAVAGAAWSPRANRYFSLAGDLGVARAHFRHVLPAGGIVAVTVDDTSDRWLPRLGVELRLDYPVGAFALGLRASWTLLWNGEGASTTFQQTGGGTLTDDWLTRGWIHAVPVSASVRYAF
jgi:hypothetical protein